MNNEVIATCFKWGYRHNRQLITTAIVSIMCISISLQGYDIYKTVSKNDNVEDFQHNLSDPNQKRLQTSDFDLIFGHNDRPEANSKSADIPKTRLNLILRGALAGLQQQPEGSAIIQGNNQEKLYLIGDTLPGGATLSEVYSDHVVLIRGGQPETLFFPDLGKGSSGLNPYRNPNSESQSSAKPRADYTKQPDSDSLEERMRKLKEQLQQANQGSP